MEIRWRLRMAAAQREVWTGAQLRRLLAERAVAGHRDDADPQLPSRRLLPHPHARRDRDDALGLPTDPSRPARHRPRPEAHCRRLGMQDSGLVRYLADNIDHDRLTKTTRK